MGHLYHSHRQIGSQGEQEPCEVGDFLGRQCYPQNRSLSSTIQWTCQGHVSWDSCGAFRKFRDDDSLRKEEKPHTTWTATQTVGRLRGGAIIGDISGAALAGSVIWKLVLIRRFVCFFLWKYIYKYTRNLHLSCWCLSACCLLTWTCRKLRPIFRQAHLEVLSIFVQNCWGKNPTRSRNGGGLPKIIKKYEGNKLWSRLGRCLACFSRVFFGKKTLEHPPSRGESLQGTIGISTFIYQKPINFNKLHISMVISQDIPIIFISIMWVKQWPVDLLSLFFRGHGPMHAGWGWLPLHWKDPIVDYLPQILSDSS